jgi:hypothetical protein
MPRDTEFSPRVYARIAGLLYLLVIAGGAFAELFVRQRLLVANDAAATANNILAHEQLFRWGFAAELIPLLCNVPLAVIFYELFKVVNRRVTLLAVSFSLVGTAVEGAALLQHYEPLILLKRGHDLGVNLQLLQAQAYMALRLQSIGFAVALTFFGCFCLAMGTLIFRSGFLPRILGIALAIEGVCYLVNSFADFLAPGIAAQVFAVLMVSGLAEVALCLWLLVRGVNVVKWQERAGVWRPTD